MYQETRAHRVLSAVLAEKRRQKMPDNVLAARWGVSVDWMHRRLSGKAGLTGSELGHIARALAVPVDQLDIPAPIRQAEAWERIKRADPPGIRADALFLVETCANSLGE